MVGWSSSHGQGESISRVPNGNGTRDGFNDVSSIAAGWVFGCSPTVELIEITTNGDDKYGALGETLNFSLILENKQWLDDTFFIVNSTLNGYPIEILDKSGKIISEIFIPANSSKTITI